MILEGLLYLDRGEEANYQRDFCAKDIEERLLGHFGSFFWEGERTLFETV